ncbi:MAG: hypothetical protein KGL39_28440, partial [Patescibacteria group bacterium]|nr:hypothetical protein [Patescibacteria group bacterium]
MAAIYRARRGQVAFERDVDLHRISAFLTRRQYGKTTNAARISLKKMMRTPGHTVVFGSVKLDLGREIVRKESEQMMRAFQVIQQLAAQGRLHLALFGEKSEMVLPDDTRKLSAAEKSKLIKPEDFAVEYEAQRLEFRLYHSRTMFSRTKVLALTPDAVGETGDLILDEVGRVKKFREVWEAVKPIISSNPDFRCLLTTTPPPDDTHYSFELLAPPIGWNPPANAEGNVYTSELGVFIRRVTAWDAYADGIPLYDDDSGEPITPDQSRQRDHDKDGWDRNYGVKFVIGGTAACSLALLEVAQHRGRPGGEMPCEFFQIENDADMTRALQWLVQNLSDGPVGIGWDLATTEKETSNPTAVTVLERVHNESVARLILTWKTANPDVDRERIRQILQAVKLRAKGGRARRLCMDATNERKFAADMRKELRGELPVELVVGSESVEVVGTDKPSNQKQVLGTALVGELEDNHLTLPASRYIREDFRLVKKEKGQFVCEPDVLGRHGDTFDSTKLALKAVIGNDHRTIVPAREILFPAQVSSTGDSPL